MEIIPMVSKILIFLVVFLVVIILYSYMYNRIVKAAKRKTAENPEPPVVPSVVSEKSKLIIVKNIEKETVSKPKKIEILNETKNSAIEGEPVQRTQKLNLKKKRYEILNDKTPKFPLNEYRYSGNTK